MVGEKPPGVFWVAYRNVDGYSAVAHTNPKAIQLSHWFWCMDVDFFAGNENKINWARVPHSGHLSEMFWSENDLRMVTAFNSNKSFALSNMAICFN